MSWDLGDPTAREDWKAEHLPSDRKRKITAEEKAEREALCLEAVKAINEATAKRYLEKDLKRWYMKNASASDVAGYIGVKPAARLGSGAVKGSWSGSMPVANRVAPMLRSMAKRGILKSEHGGDDDYRYRFHLPGEDVHTIYARLTDERERGS
jgi:hypothetical protein